MFLVLEQVCVRYAGSRASHDAVQGVTLSLAKGQIGVLIGPSGCGKTSLLRAVAGLERLAAGRVKMDGRLLADGEPYFHLADFESYVKAHDEAGALYRDHRQWTEKAILNTAAIGKFSSDRTIREYARDVWNIHAMEPAQHSQ